MKIIMNYNVQKQKPILTTTIDQKVSKDVFLNGKEVNYFDFVVCHSLQKIRIEHDKVRKIVLFWVDMKCKVLDEDKVSQVTFNTDTNKFE